jgi:alcohol dehydrogenase class IV
MSINSWQFFSPTKIIIRPDAAKDVALEVKALGGKRVMIITDPGIVKAGLVDDIHASLNAARLKVDIFDQVEPEPPARIIDQAAAFARGKNIDIIIGLGGGSSLDTAKGASIMSTNSGKVLEYAGMELVPKRGLPKIMIPTTGSGSEVTRVFAPTDEETQTKAVVYTNFNLAEVVISDPTLAVTMPPDLTADTGIDALIAAIESFVSVNANPYSNLLALEAMRMISTYLPVVYAKAAHMEARQHISLAAILANLAWQSAGLGAVHALTYVLESECNIRHARACSIMLPHVMAYNMIGNLNKFGQIAKAMGENIDHLSEYEAAQKAISAVKRLLEIVNIPYKLSEYGVSHDQLPKLVDGALRQARLFVPNPRDLKEADVRKIYQNAIG